MAGYALAHTVTDGRIAYLPVRLSAVPRLLAALRPDVAVVTGVRHGQELVYAGTVGFGPAAGRAARAVVVKHHPDGADLGGPPIEGSIVATIARPARDGLPADSRRVDDVDLAIGRNVAAVTLPDPTLQLGPGGIGAAVGGHAPASGPHLVGPADRAHGRIAVSRAVPRRRHRRLRVAQAHGRGRWPGPGDCSSGRWRRPMTSVGWPPSIGSWAATQPSRWAWTAP